VQTAVAASPTGYTACAGAATYTATYNLTDTDFKAEAVVVAYWNGTSQFVATCTADTGVQRVTLSVHTREPTPRVDERVDVIIRKPCRSTAEFPQDTLCS
jgi:hypothetical protein